MDDKQQLRDLRAAVEAVIEDDHEGSEMLAILIVDRVIDPLVADRQLRDPAELGDEDYNAAIEALIAIYSRDAEAFVSVIETARDEEAVHTTDNEASECVDDCLGCFTERLADGITRTVNGGGH